MICKTCKNYQTCKTCENHETCKTWHTCINCEHRQYGGHKWETISGYRTCAVCGTISRSKIFVNDDRLLFCANMAKQYVPKPRKVRKPKEK